MRNYTLIVDYIDPSLESQPTGGVASHSHHTHHTFTAHARIFGKYDWTDGRICRKRKGGTLWLVLGGLRAATAAAEAASLHHHSHHETSMISSIAFYLKFMVAGLDL